MSADNGRFLPNSAFQELEKWLEQSFGGIRRPLLVKQWLRVCPYLPGLSHRQQAESCSEMMKREKQRLTVKLECSNFLSPAQVCRPGQGQNSTLSLHAVPE